jgi:hypothetical protein
MLLRLVEASEMVLPLQNGLAGAVNLKKARRPGSILRVPRIGWRRPSGQRITRNRNMAVDLVESRGDYPKDRSAKAPSERPRRR